MLWPPIVLLIALWLGTARTASGSRCVAAVGAIASARWMAALAMHGNVPYDSDASRLYFGTDTHASGLLLGCAAAAVVASRSGVRQTARSPRSRTGDVARPGGARGVRLGAASRRTSSSPASTAAGSSPWPRSAPSSSSRRRGAASVLGRALDSRADALGRPALVRDLPLALARLRRHAAGARHRARRGRAARAAPGDHRRDRRALLPLPRAADPPRRLQAVAAARHGRPRRRRACGGRRSRSPRSALVAAVVFGFARAPVEDSAAQQSPSFASGTNAAARPATPGRRRRRADAHDARRSPLAGRRRRASA